jgi:hypothetical protein
VQRTRILIVAGLSLLAACKDSTSPNTIGASGSVSFTYAGGNSGSYSASGGITSTTTPDFTRNWAAGARDQATTSIAIASVQAQANNTHDTFIMVIPRQTAGNATVSVNCTETATTTCAALLVSFGESNTNDQVFQRACGLDSGTLTITSISSTRVSGTFSGTGTCFTSTGGTSSFTVTNGSFDVALVTDVPV